MSPIKNPFAHLFPDAGSLEAINSYACIHSQALNVHRALHLNILGSSTSMDVFPVPEDKPNSIPTFADTTIIYQPESESLVPFLYELIQYLYQASI
jgi:hypothetical protein